MTVRYDIKQVSRYVLTRTMNTDKGATVADLAEFTRRDDAERVMGTMRAAIHPVEVKPVAKSLSELQKCTGLVGAYKDAKSLSDVRAEDRKRTAEQGAADKQAIAEELTSRMQAAANRVVMDKPRSVREELAKQWGAK
jgi:hypothetical protein